MGYRKFSEEREAKRYQNPNPQVQRERELQLSRALDDTDIRSMIARGEPLFSHIMVIYGYNRVVRATEPAPGRRQRKRRSYGRESYDGE